MSTGIKGTIVLLRFILALAAFIADLAAKGPTQVLGAVGKLIGLLQLAIPVFSSIPDVIAEAVDGYSPEERDLLFAEIEKLSLTNVAVEHVVETALKAVVALAGLCDLLRKHGVPKASK